MSSPRPPPRTASRSTPAGQSAFATSILPNLPAGYYYQDASGRLGQEVGLRAQSPTQPPSRPDCGGGCF
ncbi:MAG: hypothetical protein WDN06_14995 [Asticcacaulis sp.]